MQNNPLRNFKEFKKDSLGSQVGIGFWGAVGRIRVHQSASEMGIGLGAFFLNKEVNVNRYWLFQYKENKEPKGGLGDLRFTFKSMKRLKEYLQDIENKHKNELADFSSVIDSKTWKEVLFVDHREVDDSGNLDMSNIPFGFHEYDIGEPVNLS